MDVLQLLVESDLAGQEAAGFRRSSDARYQKRLRMCQLRLNNLTVFQLAPIDLPQGHLAPE